LRLFIFISTSIFLLNGCSDSKRNLAVVENKYEIDLSQLDSVRENLNGFWVREDDIDEETIVWLDFYKESNVTNWEVMQYSEDIKQIEELAIPTCPTTATLIKSNGKIHFKFVSLGGSDTLEIESLYKNRFIIDGISYLRHRGYDFVKSVTIPEFTPEN
jgi:hypothetical protein